MIELKQITKEYIKQGEEPIKALNNVSLKFDYGKIYSIIGHSGSGKSTLLQIIGTLDTPTKGTLTLDEKNICCEKDEKQISLIRRDKVGFVFQSFYLDERLSSVENVMIPMYINNNFKTNKQRKEKACELLNKLGLSKRIKHLPKELSGGEQQRVAIARALANNPQIILADEPTGNLDKKNENIVFEFLSSLANEGRCVIIASHSENIKKFADVIVELDDGEVKKIYENKK